MKPLIGITAGEVVNQQYPLAPMVQGQAITYVEAIVRAGGLPIILPIVTDQALWRQLYEKCDGLLLSGGNDLDPELYGAQASTHTKRVSRRRDDQELQLLNWALEDDKPILGICRGMQLLNVALGGTLYQDITIDLPQAGMHDTADDESRESRIVHQLSLQSGTQLAEILGADKVGANAYHHQAIDKLGNGLTATAWAEDEIIEAVELPEKRFALAVQLHPESLEATIEPQWQKLFAAFVDAARQ